MKERARKSKRVLLVFFIVVLVGVIGLLCKTLDVKTKEYQKNVNRIEELNDQISDENEKAKQLQKQNKDVITDSDIEAIARQELGLIKKDEIVIRPN